MLNNWLFLKKVATFEKLQNTHWKFTKKDSLNYHVFKKAKKLLDFFKKATRDKIKTLDVKT